MFLQVNSAFTLKARRSRSEHNRDSNHAYFVSWTTHLPWGGAGVRLAFVEARLGSADPAKTRPLDRFSRPPLPVPTSPNMLFGNAIRRWRRKPLENPWARGVSNVQTRIDNGRSRVTQCSKGFSDTYASRTRTARDATRPGVKDATARAAPAAFAQNNLLQNSHGLSPGPNHRASYCRTPRDPDKCSKSPPPQGNPIQSPRVSPKISTTEHTMVC